MNRNRYVAWYTGILLTALTAACSSATRTIETAAGEVALRDESELRETMRRLWTDHVVWTRSYVVAAVANDPSASAAAARLMKNQEELGAAVVPYYGSEVGAKLTELLKDHINIAVDLVAAARAGNSTRVAEVDRRWHDNSREIAGFLAAANPNWPAETLRVMLDEHLRLTTEEAKARIETRWNDDVRVFDQILDQALQMADALSDGIIRQFPERF